MRKFLLLTQDYEQTLKLIKEKNGRLIQKFMGAVLVVDIPDTLHIEEFKHPFQNQYIDLFEPVHPMVETLMNIEDNPEKLTDKYTREFHESDCWVKFLKNNTKIDAVFQRHSNGKVYIFKGSQYIRLSENSLFIDVGYPKPIVGNWLGLPEKFCEGIDAVFQHNSNHKIYMFKGGQYVRFSEKKSKMDEGYPKPIAENWHELPKSFQAGINAIFQRKSNHKIYMFKGDQYVRLFENDFKVDDGYPKPIAGNWLGLPETFQSSIDSALMRKSNDKIYMFKDAQYVRYSNVSKGMDSGYPKDLVNNWFNKMENVVFGLSKNPDKDSTGIETSVAINSTGRVIEVHRSEASDKLWYRMGKSVQMEVIWEQSITYDRGMNPSICMNNDGVVVEVHSPQTGNKLWYHVGISSENKVIWGTSIHYDGGILPNITIDDENWCVEAHSSHGAAVGLWYRLGIVNKVNKTIEWQFENAVRYGYGYRPNIAMNNKGIVIEVHNNEGTHNTLWYTVGVLDKKRKKIDWGHAQNYGNGTAASIAITDDGFVIEVHKSEIHNTLWSLVGKVNTETKTVEWSDSKYFDDGTNPSVACSLDKSKAIQMHQSETLATLWYSTSLIVDRSRWMEKLFDSLKDKYLWEITLPGSHDTGAYNMVDKRTPCGTAPSWLPAKVVKLFAQTHTLNMKGQLENGARFFDLRSYADQDGNLYTYHDLIGDSFENILDAVQQFLSIASKELIILKISSFCNFKDENHKQLIRLIQEKIGGYLYHTPHTIFRTLFSDIVFEGPKVVVWYDTGSKNLKLPNSFYSKLNIYDQYSNRDDYPDMRRDQLQKMKEHSGSENQLFLLSWTLTFKDFCSIEKGITLHKITKKANCNLGNFLANEAKGYQINIVYVDFLEDARVTDCVITLNSKK